MTPSIPTLADIEAVRPFVYQAATRTPLLRLNAFTKKQWYTFSTTVFPQWLLQGKKTAQAGGVILLLAACQPLFIERVEHGLLPAESAENQPAWNLAQRMAHHHVPGVSVALIENFEIAWTKTYGVADASTGEPVTEHTLFQAASISKPVMAAALMRLVDQEKLTLDTRVNTLLRSWKLPQNKFTRKHPVTLAHLLSHSAGTTVHGFGGYAVGTKVPTLIQLLDGKKPANSKAVRVDKLPGETFRYSGGGTSVVQLALQDFSGQPFAEFMRENLLAPAGMPLSTYQQPLPPARLREASAGHLETGEPIEGKRVTHPEQAAAGLWTTPAELARFAIAIQRSARGGAGTLLSQASAQRMLTPLAPPAAIGFMADSPKPGYFSHGGSNAGFKCYLIAHKHNGYGAVIMTNGDNGGALAGELLRGIAREYGWEGF